ncbi:MAG: hypothetical protein IPI98_02790 [Chitinophagaceae bacterium]|nr:hypothetical protein [Chitinophagaceae bacterium]
MKSQTSKRCKSGTWAGTQSHSTEANLPKTCLALHTATIIRLDTDPHYR